MVVGIVLVDIEKDGTYLFLFNLHILIILHQVGIHRLLGDKFLDITSSDVCDGVGAPYSFFGLGVYIDVYSSYYSSPSDID